MRCRSAVTVVEPAGHAHAHTPCQWSLVFLPCKQTSKHIWILVQTTLQNTTIRQFSFFNFSRPHREKFVKNISKLLSGTITSYKINLQTLGTQSKKRHKLNIRNVQCICIVLTAKCLFQINLSGLGAANKSPKRIRISLRLNFPFSRTKTLSLIQLCGRIGKKLFNNSYLYTNKQHNYFPSYIIKSC